MFRPVSSLWKLTMMLLGLVTGALVLIWCLNSWVLARALERAARAVVLDDLGEYEALYRQVGLDGVRNLFTAGKHEADQALRIVDASGRVILELPRSGAPPAPAFTWPNLAAQPTQLAPHETRWHRTKMAGDLWVTVGRRKLFDGAELWFGKTNQSDLGAIGQLHRSISLGIAITALFAAGPLLWFSSRVLRPVHELIHKAHQLARSDATWQRLETSAAIFELKEFANAFNQSLARVQSLTEELEAANDQLAHELRTPLARIRGNVESLLSNGAGPAGRDHAVRALAEIDRASQLIQVVLSIRAGEARTLKLQMEPVCLADLMAETCELYQAAAEDRGLELIACLPRQDSAVLADRQRLQQALCNLLDNALAYTTRGGKVEVNLDHEDDAATIWVRDNGPGLRESDTDRIWRRFTRGTAASANAPGIGLGLSLVKAVVTAHGGSTGARNRPEGGAEFWIRLPAHEPAQESQSP